MDASRAMGGPASLLKAAALDPSCELRPTINPAILDHALPSPAFGRGEQSK
jgi:hypothetical protein